MRIVRLLVVGSALSAIACGRDSNTSTPDASDSSVLASMLVLDEVRSIPLPIPHGVVGAVAGHGRVAVWSPDTFLVLSEGSPPRSLRIPGTRIVTAAFRPDGGLDVVTASEAAIHRFAEDGTPTGTRMLETSARLDGAVRTEAGWFLGGIDGGGRYRIFRVSASGGPALIHTIDPDTLLAGTLPAYRLSSWGDGVLVTEAERPFRTWRVHSDGTVRSPIMPKGFGDREPVPGERWITVSVIDLGRGFLQTLADLASDRRLLVLIDSSGTTLRTTHVEAPVGLAGRVSDDSLIVGVRQVDVSEVVLYRWRWTNPHLTNGES